MRTALLSLVLLGCTPTAPTEPHLDARLSPGGLGICAERVLREGAYVPQAESVSGTHEPCSITRHAIAGSEGSTIAIRLTHWDRTRPPHLLVRSARGRRLTRPQPVVVGDELRWTLPHTGEFLVDLAPAIEGLAPTDYGLEVVCVDGCDRSYTRYPIVMMHGAAGTDTYLGILDYWFGIEQPMADAGFDVQIHSVAALAGVEARGEEWATIIDNVLLTSDARKVNLLGHSQGGLDARYVVSGLGYGDRVASLTTVATPHRGTVAADLAAGVIGLGPFDGAVLDAFASALIGIVGLQGDELTQQMQDLTRSGAAEFNAAYPDDPAVAYRSWAGRSCRLLDLFCQWDNEGEIVTPALAATYELTVWNEGPNDGLVSVSSARWGDYQGALPADHMDEVGQIIDLFDGPFDHAEFYLSEAETLRLLGH